MRFSLAAVFIACLSLAGCQSKHADTAALQQQYQQAHKLYIDDCVTPMTSGAGNALGGKSSEAPSPQQQADQQQEMRSGGEVFAPETFRSQLQGKLRNSNRNERSTPKETRT